MRLKGNQDVSRLDEQRGKLDGTILVAGIECETKQRHMGLLRSALLLCGNRYE